MYFRNIETPKTKILPFSLLENCKYDEFRSSFNVAKKLRCDTRMVFSPSYYRDFTIVLSYFRVFTILLSWFDRRTIVFSP